ncbi:hypothetical protein LJC47_01640 [Desulfosarcina sp. OttesenSCG-928-B08]|nr:hypothetical protein [Desulfosarcina sp. OttesenSCG-928-B08]
MSSFIGHTLIGIAIGSDQKILQAKGQIIAFLYFSVLAILPDLDYLVFWLFNCGMAPRYTHSIGYCAAVSSLGLLISRTSVFKKITGPLHLSAYAICLIPFSHLVLDYFVGVHKNPILWPLYAGAMTSDIGILPSAGKIALTNIFLWRNLMIEMAILIPVASGIYVRGQIRKIPVFLRLILLVFLCFGTVIGMHLTR